MTIAIICAGWVSALAFYIIFWKVGIRRVCGYDIAADIGSTVLLMLMFAGTYTGMIAAVIAGLMLSVLLIVTKRFTGYEKLKIVAGKPIWVRYDHTGAAI